MAVMQAVSRIWKGMWRKWLSPRGRPGSAADPAAGSLVVERSRQVDEAEPGADGVQEYRYEYDLYRFGWRGDGTQALHARSYVDEPRQAHFLNTEVAGRARPLRPSDLQSPLLRAAARHLRDNAGKHTLAWLSGRGRTGYEPVPDSVFARDAAAPHLCPGDRP